MLSPEDHSEPIIILPWRLLTTPPPEWMLEPDETQRPPITTSEVEAMMHLCSWFADLKLCISSGYEDVGHFQFLNKTTFTVGGATFVFNG